MIRSAVAVIPARGGSKRIPRKNVRLLSGKPLLTWAIELCLASEAFDEVLVSTDDEEIAVIARQSGASVPFMRPAHLSDDHAPTVDVVQHALLYLDGAGTAPELCCCVYPASVFLSGKTLRAAGELLLASTSPYVTPVLPYDYPIQRALRMDPGGALAFMDPSYADHRTQDLEPAYHDAGQFYWGRVEAWTSRLPILANSLGFPLPAGCTIDIDEEADWQRAQALHTSLLSGRGGDGAQ